MKEPFFYQQIIQRVKKIDMYFFSITMATELRHWLQYRDRYKDSEYCFCTIKGTQLLERSFESNFTVYGESLEKEKAIEPRKPITF